jgi:Na+/proline symporter
MMKDINDKGWFANIFTCCILTGALAAIMSSVDSCLIGASNIISLDIVKPMIWKVRLAAND